MEGFEEVEAGTQPNQEEIVLYMVLLGAHLPQDASFTKTAAGALKRMLPKGWKSFRKSGTQGPRLFLPPDGSAMCLEPPGHEVYVAMFQKERGGFPRPDFDLHISEDGFGGGIFNSIIQHFEQLVEDVARIIGKIDILFQQMDQSRVKFKEAQRAWAKDCRSELDSVRREVELISTPGREQSVLDKTNLIDFVLSANDTSEEILRIVERYRLLIKRQSVTIADLTEQIEDLTTRIYNL